jgi:hypothetical protein
MMRGSPLKKSWKPGTSNNTIIDDMVTFNNPDNCFFNYIFEHIHAYIYDGCDTNTLQRYFIWRSIRMFIELKHRDILSDKRGSLIRRLLSKNIYEFACYQELMFDFVSK